MTSLLEAIAEVDAALARQEHAETLAEEAERLSASLFEFTKAAWPIIMPRPLVDTWHVQTLCEHFQAAYERDITRLVATIQPGSLKSTLGSVMAPVWWWTRKPQERILTASWRDRLAERDARYSRLLMLSRWFQARWGDVFALARDENMKTRYSNDKTGYRVATHVGGGTGDRGGILHLDDPHNAGEAESETKAKMTDAIEWLSNTWLSRLDDLVDDPGAMVVIGQRIHEDDLIGHLLTTGQWTHLCLPTYHERKHPMIVTGHYPEKVELPSGKIILGDPRKHAEELLAPTVQNEEMLAKLVQKEGMTAHIFAGQYQQRPAPREGKLLKRGDWRYYDPELSYYAARTTFGPAQVRELASRIGHFDSIVHSWDTSVKDRAHSDFVSGQAWATLGAHRFLLRLVHGRLGLNATIEAMLDLANWAQPLWPDIPQYTLIENSANGPDSAEEIRARVQGVILDKVVGSKWARAEGAEPALVGHNCYLPGYAETDGATYSPRTAMEVQVFVEELAAFDTGSHDDQVDAWSAMVNWTRNRGGATMSVPSGQATPPRFRYDRDETALRPTMR